VVERTYEGLRDRGRYWGFYPEGLFLTRERDEMADDYVQARQDEILGDLLRERGSDDGFVRCLFTIIAHFSIRRRVLHIKTLLETNRSLELFRELELQPSNMSWEGSKVPVLEERAGFWRSLRPLLGSLDLLGHKKLVEEQLEYACEAIARAKREEFMED